MLLRLLGLAAATVTIAVTTHAGLLWLLLWAASAAAVQIKASSKVQSNEKRIGLLVQKHAAVANEVTTMQSQRGSMSSFSESVANLPSPSTSDPNVDATVVTTSGNFNGGTLSSHNHSYGHTHTTGMDPYWNTMAASFNSLVSQLNTMLGLLQAADIL